eukprot:6136331-Pleurochrysis_carterae.AAC.2
MFTKNPRSFSTCAISAARQACPSRSSFRQARCRQAASRAASRVRAAHSSAVRLVGICRGACSSFAIALSRRRLKRSASWLILPHSVCAASRSLSAVRATSVILANSVRANSASSQALTAASTASSSRFSAAARSSEVAPDSRLLARCSRASLRSRADSFVCIALS